MIKILFIISFYFFSIFSPVFGNYNENNFTNTQIIYKEKPKKKKSDKNKLDRKKRNYWEKSNRIFHRFFRSSIYSDNNPANLAINSPFYKYRFDLPSVNFQFTNNSITPQLFIDHFSTGGTLTKNEQTELNSNFSNIQLLTQLNINPGRFEIGKFRMSSNLVTLLNGDLSGDIISLPFSPFYMGASFNQKFDIEIISFLKNSIGFGQKIKSKYGTIRGGINYNFYKGIIYLKTKADTFNLTNDVDNFSTQISISLEGSNLFWNRDSTFNAKQLGELSNGFDIGLGVNLKKLIRQNLDVELIIQNIGSSLSFKNSKIETYSSELFSQNPIEFADSIDLFEDGLDTLIKNNEIKIDLPRKSIIKVTFQPIPQIVLSGGFEKYSTNFLTQKSKPNIYLCTGLYPSNSYVLNYELRTNNKQIVQTIGIGFQTNYMDLLFNISSYDGIINGANGIGAGFKMSFFYK